MHPPFDSLARLCPACSWRGCCVSIRRSKRTRSRQHKTKPTRKGGFSFLFRELSLSQTQEETENETKNPVIRLDFRPSTPPYF
jgi:hypothetical protein